MERAVHSVNVLGRFILLDVFRLCFDDWTVVQFEPVAGHSLPFASHDIFQPCMRDTRGYTVTEATYSLTLRN